ncbi:hypothetical protein CKO25_16620 [Thiocapsa imhoffii]|uniref:Uncharacterized protein n=1 Tax=Thiocapsa imhoffii TaxID=382777 RepID=A0A9X0WKM4_9GAMM|nr:hypothetical protein [Thiocapsa imhoffii]MBK1646241.1 hypothetical protein [Thiocapsa imhoffii]
MSPCRAEVGEDAVAWTSRVRFAAEDVRACGAPVRQDRIASSARIGRPRGQRQARCGVLQVAGHPDRGGDLLFFTELPSIVAGELPFHAMPRSNETNKSDRRALVVGGDDS